MARTETDTPQRIVAAASRLFYSEGIKSVSVDAVAAAAGLTKRTLYYHFKSKDDLVAAYLAARDQPNLVLFQRWFAEAGGGLPDKVEAIFGNLARSARHPKWKGCGFLRTSANWPTCPATPRSGSAPRTRRNSKAGCALTFEAEGICEATTLARQILLLLDGSFAVVLLHRDASLHRDRRRSLGVVDARSNARATPLRGADAVRALPRHCERSEAIHRAAEEVWIASLRNTCIRARIRATR